MIIRYSKASIYIDMTYLSKRMNSFKHAARGILTLFKDSSNALIQLVTGVIVIIMGFILKVSSLEWVAIIVVIGLVLSMEAINTALERLSDYACNNEVHPLIKKVKDISAAAVLIVALVALAVGLIIFLPKITELL